MSKHTLPDAAKNKAMAKYYSFDYTIDGAPCDIRYDPVTERTLYNCEEAIDAVADVVDRIERVIGAKVSKSGIDTLDLRKFLCKHMQAMVKVEQALRRGRASKRRRKVIDLKPEAFYPKEQCMLEAIQEQSAKANNAAAANGTPDDVKYTVTKDMVKAKMQEKAQQPK
jgi:hypothetical protein